MWILNYGREKGEINIVNLQHKIRISVGLIVLVLVVIVGAYLIFKPTKHLTDVTGTWRVENFGQSNHSTWYLTMDRGGSISGQLVMPSGGGSVEQDTIHGHIDSSGHIQMDGVTGASIVGTVKNPDEITGTVYGTEQYHFDAKRGK